MCAGVCGGGGGGGLTRRRQGRYFEHHVKLARADAGSAGAPPSADDLQAMARLSRALSVALAQPVPLSYNRAGGSGACACARGAAAPGMASGAVERSSGPESALAYVRAQAAAAMDFSGF